MTVAGGSTVAGGAAAVQAGSAMLSAGAASLVEFVEALTVVLAVAAARGWRGTLAGAAGGLGALVAVLAVFGPALGALPIGMVRIVVGAFLLLFGLRWLRRATLRSAGAMARRDEAAAFGRHRARAEGFAASRGGFDGPAAGAAFQAVFVEGVEVVLVVLAVGAGGRGLLAPAAAGAGIALVAVCGLGAMLHRPLGRVPDNALKLLAGAVLSAFGAVWLGEGAGVRWPGGAAVVPVLAAGLLAVSWAAAARLRRSAGGG